MHREFRMNTEQTQFGGTMGSLAVKVIFGVCCGRQRITTRRPSVHYLIVFHICCQVELPLVLGTSHSLCTLYARASVLPYPDTPRYW